LRIGEKETVTGKNGPVSDERDSVMGEKGAAIDEAETVI